MRCRHCTEVIIKDSGMTVHLNEMGQPGSPYMQKCIDCGWKGSDKRYFLQCPACDSPSLMNDHAAQV